MAGKAVRILDDGERPRGAFHEVVSLTGKGRERGMLAPIVRTLCDRIATRTIAPGYRITEQNLCDEFSIARSTAREVLTVLQQRGLIDRPPNRSAIVVGLTKDEMIEVLNVREVLDALCVRLATENSAPESWQDMVDLFGEPMERAKLDGDVENYMRNLTEFHERSRQAAANPILRDMQESIDDKSRYIIRRTILLPGRVEQGLGELRQVIDAMRHGDALLAEQLRRENIRSQKRFFMRYADLVSRL